MPNAPHPASRFSAPPADHAHAGAPAASGEAVGLRLGHPPHRHGHAHDHSHPAPARVVSLRYPSLLGMSALARFALVLPLVAGLWGLALWALKAG